MYSDIPIGIPHLEYCSSCAYHLPDTLFSPLNIVIHSYIR